MIKVDTNQYQFAHGRKPKGDGLWILEIEYPGREWKQEKQTVSRNMPYTSAIASAKKYIREELNTHVATITVLS